MSCPHLDDHLRTDLDAGTSAFLRGHAESCAECGHRLEVRRAAYAVLASDVPPLSPHAQAAQWARLEAATREPEAKGRWWIPALAGLAATAAVALLWIEPRNIEPEKSPKTTAQPGLVRLQADQKLEVNGLRIIAVREATLRFPEGLDAKRLRLLSGELHLLPIVAAPPAWTIDTPLESFELVGNRANVSAEPLPAEVPAPVETRINEATTAPAVPPARTRPANVVVSREPTEPGTPRPIAAQRDEPPLPREAGRIDSTPPIPKNPSSPEDASDQSALREARSLIGRDDVRAVELAEGVIAKKPEAKTEAVALMIAADGWRRRGGRTEAVSYYRLAAEHPMGAPFAEEAYLRQATLLGELQRNAEAKAALGDARRRFGNGGRLGPERTALTAWIEYRQGLIADAARTLIEYDGPDRILDEPKVTIAEALVQKDPTSAARLAKGVGEGPFFERATRVLEAIRKKDSP